MKPPPSVHGWQTSLADLSLILFLIAASAVGRHQREQEHQPAPRAAPPPSAQGEPLAVYAAAPGAPPLARWLADQAPDPRQQLTITARYGAEPGAQGRALGEAARLLAEAQGLGRRARLVVEPGEGPARVALAFDAAPSARLP